MKTTFFIAAIAVCACSGSFAQMRMAGDSLVRTISVTGFAMLTEKPDKVNVNIEISDEYCASPTENIDWLTDQYENALRKLGIGKSQSKLVSEKTSELGYTNVNRRTQMVTRTYELALENYAMYYALQSQLPARGIYAVVAGISYSGKAEMEVKVRTMAVEDARNKATTLVEAAGSKLGKIIGIEEANPNASYEDWGDYARPDAEGHYETDTYTGEERYLVARANEEITVFCAVRTVFAIVD